MKKKILFVSHILDVCGAPLLLQKVVSFIQKSGKSCYVYSPLDGELNKSYQDENIQVYIKDFSCDRLNREQPFDISSHCTSKISTLIRKYSGTDKKIGIRCAGIIANKLITEFDFSNINLVALFDTNPSLIGQNISGVQIYHPEKITELGVEVMIVAHPKPVYFQEELKNFNIKVYGDFFTESFTDYLKKLLDFFSGMIKSLIYFKKLNPDVFFINNIRNFWLVYIAKILGKKCIWAIHECFAPQSFKAFPRVMFLKSFNFADKVVFPSNAVYLLFKDFISSKKVCVVHNGIDIEPIEKFKAENDKWKIRQELGIPANHTVVVNVGVFDPIKAQKTLVKAAFEVLKNSNNFTFILVGSKDDVYSEELLSMIKESGFESNFRLIKVTKDVFQYYLASDIYVCSSLKESFGLSVVEAMAFELPVIASNTYALPEIIEDGISGILVSLNNLEKEIAENITTLALDKKMSSEIAKNGYNRVKAVFVADRMFDSYKEIVNQVCW